jgi:hypothetical protein
MKKLLQNFNTVCHEIADCVRILRQLRNFRNEDLNVL